MDFILKVTEYTADIYIKENYNNDLKRWCFVKHTCEEDFHGFMSDVFLGKFPEVSGKYRNEYNNADSILLTIGDYKTRIYRKGVIKNEKI